LAAVRTDTLLTKRYRASRHLSFVGIGLLAVILFAASAAIWDRREETITRSEQELTNLGIVLAEQTARSMQAIDLVLQETRRMVVAVGVDSPDQFDRLMATEEVHRFLDDELRVVPQADAVALVSTGGKLINNSRFWPVPAADFSDRDYYEYLRASTTLPMRISALLRSEG
jgi:hypothetical protein